MVWYHGIKTQGMYLWYLHRITLLCVHTGICSTPALELKPYGTFIGICGICTSQYGIHSVELKPWVSVVSAAQFGRSSSLSRGGASRPPPYFLTLEVGSIGRQLGQQIGRQLGVVGVGVVVLICDVITMVVREQLRM